MNQFTLASCSSAPRALRPFSVAHTVSPTLTEVVNATELRIAAVEGPEGVVLLLAPVPQRLARSLECLILGQQLPQEPLPAHGDALRRILDVGRDEAPAVAAATASLPESTRSLACHGCDSKAR